MGEEEKIWNIDYSRKEGGETRGKPGKPEETQRSHLLGSVGVSHGEMGATKDSPRGPLGDNPPYIPNPPRLPR